MYDRSIVAFWSFCCHCWSEFFVSLEKSYFKVDFFSQNSCYIRLIINAQQAKGREIKIYAFIYLMVLGHSDTREAVYPWTMSQT